METRPWHQRDTGAGAASTSSCPWLPVPFARGLSTAASTPSATPPASASAPALESAPDIEPFTPSVSASAPEPDRFSSGARRVVRLGGRRDATGLHGIVHLLDSSSNTILTFTDPAGRVLAWMSAGRAGFKNSRKGLPVAAEAAAEKLAKRALELGYTSASVKMKGIGNNKQYAVQSLAAAGLKLTQLKDVTAIPYNGCRRPKKRRL